jgi:hypothetical protein
MAITASNYCAVSVSEERSFMFSLLRVMTLAIKKSLFFTHTGIQDPLPCGHGETNDDSCGVIFRTWSPCLLWLTLSPSAGSREKDSESKSLS